MPDDYDYSGDNEDRMPDETSIEDYLSQNDEKLQQHDDALRTLLLTSMAQQQQQLPAALPTQTGGTPAYEFGRGIGVLQPPPSPIAATPAPASQGRMYMGPALTPPQEQQFMQSAPGTRANLMPPPTGTPQETYDRMQGAGLIQKPSSRLMPTDIAWSPGYDTWAAQQDFKADIDRGIPADEALRRNPKALGGVAARGIIAAPKHYNVAGVGLVDETGRVITPHPATRQTRTVQGVGLVDAQTGEVIRPAIQKPDTQTVTETIPANPGSPAVPAQAARSGFLGIGSRPAVAAVPAVPATGERRITRKVPVEPPADTSGIPKSYIDYLKAHPESAASFDAK